ncbi:DNA-binding response regulator [Lachnospiraceae bacterium]|nr:DNA-binding response regulator [Lachnospiraceae bacterium]
MRYKILIVDDEPGITDMIREYFEPEYEVYTADSGEEAIKKLSVKPDLILLDINMPKMDGLEVCRKIRGFVTCPILFLTARVESPDKITGFQAGADDYIPESVNPKGENVLKIE